MNSILLRAIEYARNGDFPEADDLLRGFSPRSAADERDVDYALKRVEELRTRGAKGAVR